MKASKEKKSRPANDLPFTLNVVEVLRLLYSNGGDGQGNSSHKPEHVRDPWPRDIRATLLSVNIRNRYGQAYGYGLKQARLTTYTLSKRSANLFDIIKIIIIINIMFLRASEELFVYCKHLE